MVFKVEDYQIHSIVQWNYLVWRHYLFDKLNIIVVLSIYAMQFFCMIDEKKSSCRIIIINNEFKNTDKYIYTPTHKLFHYLVRYDK